jgi:2-oxo-4-hydroxy-4-carboxy-5-ureidoimidazoline decarboxylase
MSADELARFNALPLEVAREKLLACCSSPAWAERMASGRPYSSARDAVRQSSAIVARLTVPDLEAALAGHAQSAVDSAADGSDPGGPDAPGLPAAPDDDALAKSRREYEQRFGHIYLAFVTGRSSAQQQLAQVRARLRNPYGTEWHVVRSELQKINEARLHGLLAGS